MKVQLVVSAPGASLASSTRSPGELLATLGPVRQVLPGAWVVLTVAAEREVLMLLETAFPGIVKALVVRLDLGGFAAHLGTDETLTDWVDSHLSPSSVILRWL